MVIQFSGVLLLQNPHIMSQLDLLIIIIYSFTTFFIVSKAIDSLDAKVKVDFNAARLNAELEKHDLAGKIEIKIPLEKRYGLDNHPKVLSVKVANKSESTLYIDWDRSSITVLGGPSRRVIRLTPYKRPDLSHPQVFSVVPPGQSLSEQVTAEDVLQPNPENEGALEPSKPLLNIASLKDNKDSKPLFNAFMGQQTTLSYMLWLVCQISEQGSASRGDRLYILPCELVARKMPWTDSLPWAG